MADPQQALLTQLANIEKRSGKTLAELGALLKDSGAARHGEQVAWLKATLGLGHGDANTLVHHLRGASPGASGGDAAAAGVATDPLDAIYTGAKAALRPVHEALMAAAHGFGAFDVATKKGYVSLRRSKQFAMVGPATQSKIELGLNMKGVPATTRLVEQAPGGMCQYKPRLGSVEEVDAELIAWLRRAYDSAG